MERVGLTFPQQRPNPVFLDSTRRIMKREKPYQVRGRRKYVCTKYYVYHIIDTYVWISHMNIRIYICTAIYSSIYSFTEVETLQEFY